MDGLWGRSSSGVWSHEELGHRRTRRDWYDTVCAGGWRFVAAWVREDEKTSENRLRKKEAAKACKVVVVSGVTEGNFRRLIAASNGSTQGLPKRP